MFLYDDKKKISGIAVIIPDIIINVICYPKIRNYHPIHD